MVIKGQDAANTKQATNKCLQNTIAKTAFLAPEFCLGFCPLYIFPSTREICLFSFTFLLFFQFDFG